MGQIFTTGNFDNFTIFQSLSIIIKIIIKIMTAAYKDKKMRIIRDGSLTPSAYTYVLP